MAGALCQGEKSLGWSWRDHATSASQDLEEAHDFMGNEKGSHMEDFNQDGEFEFHQAPSGPCTERKLDAGPAVEGGKSVRRFL